MREQRLILEGSPCSMDFFDRSIKTVSDSLSRGPRLCPKFTNCNSGALGPGKLQCVMLTGLEVARYSLKESVSVSQEIKDFRKKAKLKPPGVKGYMDTSKNDFKILTDWNEICNAVFEFARVILDLQPSEHMKFGTVFKLSKEKCIKNYPILNQSVWDEEGSQWMHSCGVLLMSAVVIHSIHDGPFPLSGSGRTWREEVPFCPACQEMPDEQGSPTKSDPYEDREKEILRKMRQHNS
ncbi:MAG: hypothetical protein GTN40_05085 [Candidatus Aenigmarchaeota archaeon]|nr:hypothetical protein [Candidatus Aenigmarchaeota archaeon]